METQLVQKERLFEDKIKVGHPSNFHVIENCLHLRMKPSYNLPTSVRQYIVPEVILINAFIIILSSPLQREIFICYM